MGTISGVKRPLRKIQVEVYRPAGTRSDKPELIDEKSLAERIFRYPLGTIFKEDYTYDRGDVFRFRMKTGKDRLDRFMAIPFFMDKAETINVLKRLMRFKPKNRVRLVTSFIDQKQTDDEMTETLLLLMSLKRKQMIELIKSTDPAKNRDILSLLYGDRSHTAEV